MRLVPDEQAACATPNKGASLLLESRGKALPWGVLWGAPAPSRWLYKDSLGRESDGHADFLHSANPADGNRCESPDNPESAQALERLLGGQGTRLRAPSDLHLDERVG